MNNLYQDLLKAPKYKETALTFMGNKMSTVDFVKNIDNMAGFLSSIGIKKCDAVGIIAPNIPTAIIGFYAINKIGAVANIFHPLIATSDMVNKLKTTNTKAIFVYDLFYRKHKKALKSLGIKVIICSSKDYLNRFTRFVFSLGLDVVRGITTTEYTVKDFTKSRPSKVEYNEECCYLHSSGTDKEKTVVLTNENFIELKNKMVDVIGYENLPNERMLVSLPIFHCFGLGIGVHSALSLGVDVILMPTFNTKSMVKLVKKYEATILIVIPSMIRKFVKNGFSDSFCSVKHIYCGGDRMSSELREQFDDLNKVNGCKILEGYGLTELTGVCVVNTEKNYKAGSIGKPLTDIEVLAIDDNDKVVQTNEVGELVINSSTVMKGYYDNTNNLFSYNGKNYFRTGDLVRIDSDGFLYYIDRKKDVIKISGINVFPKDIEELVLKTCPVKQAVCVEKAIDNKPYVYLYVVAKPSIELEEQIKNTVKKNLLKYYWLKEVVFLEQMPYTKNGKIDKKSLEKKVDYN